VRNFEYYTGTVFEFRAAGCRMGSGGRYDGLIGLVGGPSLPASGFALSLAEIVSHFESVPQATAPPHQWLVAVPDADSAALAEAFAVAARLRANGYRVAIALAGMQAEPDDHLLTISRRDGGFTYELRKIEDEESRTFRSPDEVLRIAEAEKR
jgi:histidyl-tRNA synthetase